MVDFAEHRKRYSAMMLNPLLTTVQQWNKRLQAVAAWLQNDKMYTGGSIKELREAISFQPQNKAWVYKSHWSAWLSFS